MKNRGYTYTSRVERSGETLLGSLAARFTHSDVGAWRARIDRGEVEVDGAPAAPESALHPGQLVSWARPPWDEPEVPLTFDVLHDDGEVLAVHKPAGLPTAPAGGFLDHTLLALVRRRFPNAAPLHRLGRGTSGVVLFGNTPRARAALLADFRGGRVDKRYRALAAGVISTDTLAVDAPIGPAPHEVLGEVWAAVPGGKPSRTEATVLERRADTTLLEVRLLTGRPHQIRIHLAHAGHPLVGDPLYAPGGLPHPHVRALPGDGGYALHSFSIVFSHPLTGEALCIVAPPPATLRRIDEG